MPRYIPANVSVDRSTHTPGKHFTCSGLESRTDQVFHSVVHMKRGKMDGPHVVLIMGDQGLSFISDCPETMLWFRSPAESVIRRLVHQWPTSRHIVQTDVIQCFVLFCIFTVVTFVFVNVFVFFVFVFVFVFVLSN